MKIIYKKTKIQFPLPTMKRKQSASEALRSAFITNLLRQQFNKQKQHELKTLNSLFVL